MKLSDSQKHFIRLVAKDSGEDGWTRVSDVVMRGMKASKDFVPPKDLAEIEPLESGRGRARLTERGKTILDYI